MHISGEEKGMKGKINTVNFCTQQNNIMKHICCEGIGITEKVMLK